MSADLFAEFNAPPPSSSSSQQQPRPQPLLSQDLKQDASSSPGAQDPFALLSGSIQTNFTAQPQQENSPAWPSFPPQPRGSYQGWNSTQPSPHIGSGRTSHVQQEEDDGEDGWGDFEVAQPSAPAGRPPVVSATNSVDRPAGRLVRASTLDIINNSLVDTGYPSSHSLEPAKSKPKVPVLKPRMKKGPVDPSVIFDVADFELQEGEGDGSENGSEDEFGDFEAVVSTKPQSTAQIARQANPPSLDLLSLDDEPPKPIAQPQVSVHTTKATPVSLGFGATKLKQSQHARAPSKSRPSSTTAKKVPAKTVGAVKPIVNNDDADEWGDWDDASPKPQISSTPLGSNTPADSWDWDSGNPGTGAGTGISATIIKESAADEPPPINVPPPSVLLSAFPALLNTGSEFFKPVAGSNTSLKQRILSDPKASDFLRGYILLAVTAGHIIAGRKHRWHRDKILAKSMSLSAAGSKGMKLAGVDKTQSAREDREASDVATVWRENVGRLRSAVAAANSADQRPLKVPELSETLPIQTAKLAPTAPKPCVICGLKREERVAKVDHEVEDSFGEWWVDHWGHRACKNFWIQHEVALRQR